MCHCHNQAEYQIRPMNLFPYFWESYWFLLGPLPLKWSSRYFAGDISSILIINQWEIVNWELYWQAGVSLAANLQQVAFRSLSAPSCSTGSHCCPIKIRFHSIISVGNITRNWKWYLIENNPRNARVPGYQSISFKCVLEDQSFTFGTLLTRV